MINTPRLLPVFCLRYPPLSVKGSELLHYLVEGSQGRYAGYVLQRFAEPRPPQPHSACRSVPKFYIALQEEARADLQAAAAALEKERQAPMASTTGPEVTAAATAAKPRNNSAVIESDSDIETAAPAGMHLT